MDQDPAPIQDPYFLSLEGSSPQDLLDRMFLVFPFIHFFYLPFPSIRLRFIHLFFFCFFIHFFLVFRSADFARISLLGGKRLEIFLK